MGRTHIRAALAAAALALTPALAPAARALDLESALRQVAAANPTLAARRADADAARRRIGPAGAWTPPTIELGLLDVPARSGGFDHDMMTTKTVGIEQRVPIGGANGLAARSARAEAGAATAVVDRERNRLFGEALEAYADAWTAAALRRGADAHAGLLARFEESARVRYASGSGRLDEVLRAEAERASARADREMLGAEERAAVARLAALRGVAPDAPPDPHAAPDTLAAPELAAVPADPAAWLAAVNESQPALRELTAARDQYRDAARAARRSAWPGLTLRASYGFREPLAGVDQENLWSASAAFTLPLLLHGRELGEGAAWEARAEASESDARAARLALAAEVVRVHAEAWAAQRSAALLADSVVTVERRAVEAIVAGYAAGTTDLWHLLEAGHALYDDEVATARARQRQLLAQARLVALTGRGDLVGVALPAAAAEAR